MPLPASLLGSIERHACFTGTYHYESPVEVCTDAAHPLERALHVACGDCLSFRVGALARLLPTGMTQYSLADALSAHMRAIRGFRWAFSGYHAVGPGFWLSAAAYTDALFLVDASRNRHGQTEIDLLVEAFRYKLAQPADPAMLNTALYATETIYVDMRQPLSAPVRSKQDLLALPQCSRTPKPGLVRVAMVEFVPLAHASPGAHANTHANANANAQAPASSSHSQPPPILRPLTATIPGSGPLGAPQAPASIITTGAPIGPPGPFAGPVAAAGKKLAIGETCPTCGELVMERPLFSGTFIGCLC